MKANDVLTLIALVVGPAMAVGIQLWFTEKARKLRLQHQILDTLMAYRGRLLHPEAVGALNRIEIVFHGEKGIIDSLYELLDHLEKDQGEPSNAARRDDLVVGMITKIGELLGYRLSHNNIKTRGYLPKGMVDEFTHQTATREGVTAILKGQKAILVKLQNDNATSSIPPIINVTRRDVRE